MQIRLKLAQKLTHRMDLSLTLKMHETVCRNVNFKKELTTNERSAMLYGIV